MLYKEKSIEETFIDLGVLLINDHFVFTSGLHSSSYINKDALLPNTKIVNRYCRLIANHFSSLDIDLVLGPEMGGVILSHLVANELSRRFRQVLSIYAEKDVNGQLYLKRGYSKLLRGKRMLIVDDTTTTGGSLRKLVELAKANGAYVVAVTVLCNRGNVTKEDVGDVPELFSLINLELGACHPQECFSCKLGIPINTEFGHGKSEAL